MSLQDDIKYLGVAMSNPVRLIAGRADLSAGVQAVAESLMTLLLTPKGRKFFNPDYGCRISNLLFEPNDDVLDNMGYFYIKEAVDDWEKRVKFVDCTFTRDDNGFTGYMVDYVILQYSQIKTLIFPFYTQLDN